MIEKKENKSGSNKIFGSTVFYFFVILYAVITLIPFLWSIITSFKPISEMSTINFHFSTLTLKNYIYME